MNFFYHKIRVEFIFIFQVFISLLIFFLEQNMKLSAPKLLRIISRGFKTHVIAPVIVPDKPESFYVNFTHF